MITQESAPSLAGWSSPLDHVLGNTRLSDLKPKLEQVAQDTRCSPKRVFYAHPPDQPAEIRLDLWPPSSGTRLPTPIEGKADPIPTSQRLGTDDRESLQDRWEPAIELNEKPAIAVRQLGPPPHLTPQDNQLMSERRILCLKPALRLEWRSQNGQYKVGQRDHCANLPDSIAQELGIRFSVHTGCPQRWPDYRWRRPFGTFRPVSTSGTKRSTRHPATTPVARHPRKAHRRSPSYTGRTKSRSVSTGRCATASTNG